MKTGTCKQLNTLTKGWSYPEHSLFFDDIQKAAFIVLTDQDYYCWVTWVTFWLFWSCWMKLTYWHWGLNWLIKLSNWNWIKMSVKNSDWPKYWLTETERLKITDWKSLADTYWLNLTNWYYSGAVDLWSCFNVIIRISP